MHRIKMGLTSGKESRVNRTVDEIELLTKSGKKQAHDIIEIFREMELKIVILKGEKEFLTTEIKRMDLSNCGRPNRREFINETTQTDRVMALSKENITLCQRCNSSLMEENAETQNRYKQADGQSEGNILTNVACQALFSGDKYFSGSDEPSEQYQVRYDYRQYESEQEKIRSKNLELEKIVRVHKQTIREYKDEMKLKISKLEEQDKKIRELTDRVEDDKMDRQKKSKQIEIEEEQKGELKTKIVQLQGNLDVSQRNLLSAEQTHEITRKKLAEIMRELDEFKTRFMELDKELNLIKNENIHLQDEKHRLTTETSRLREVDDNNKELKKRLQQVQGQYDIRGSVIEEKKKEITKKDIELKEKDFKLSALQNEAITVSKQLKNELSLEAVKVHNCKTTIVDLEENVSLLKKELNNTKQENEDFRKKEKHMQDTNKQLHCEKEELKAKSEHLAKANDTLVLENDTLRKEKEKLAAKAMKTYISFHSVLKQPQSDQAVGDIVSLLQRELGDIEVVEERKRGSNVPLLVVLYNLSRITDDTKGAMKEVEASSNVALVVLHPKEVKQSSEQILTQSTDPELRKSGIIRKLGIIVDMRFLTAEGIMTDELTSHSVKQLATFVGKGEESVRPVFRPKFGKN